MKRSLLLWQFGGFTFAMVLGTTFHFLYGWTDSVIVTPISAVNESTWEHMKILFFPMLFFAVFEWFFLRKEYDNFWSVKLFGIVMGITFIPILFYTYKGCFGEPPAWLNIAFFFISGGISYYYESLIFKSRAYKKFNKISLALIIIIALAFVIFTYYTPELPLFLDPLTNTYGLT